MPHGWAVSLPIVITHSHFSRIHAVPSVSHPQLPRQHRTLRLQTHFDMCEMTPTASSSYTNLQAIFEASLKEYEKKTEKSLLTHPLMAQLQACDSPAAILELLRSQAEKVEQTMDVDDKLIKWLDPVVNVLSASSSVISAGVGLVKPIRLPSCKGCNPMSGIMFLGVLTRECHLRWCRCPPFGSYRPGSLSLGAI